MLPLSFSVLAILASSLAQLVVPTAAAAAPGKPVVYLTFDDGPGPDTPKFLDLLDHYGIKGTFFVTGRAVTANPNTAVRIVQDGHTIANHTWNHPRLSALSDAGIRSEFVRTTDLIETTTGVTPTCYRPPYGATNARVHARPRPSVCRTLGGPPGGRRATGVCGMSTRTIGGSASHRRAGVRPP